LPHTFGIGTDRSTGALVTARRNAVDLGLSPRAAFVACDYSSALAGPFDLVVSNPPYIAGGDIRCLDVDVREHDPHLALDGGADGLVAYRAIAADARRLLATGGLLVIEIGFGQVEAISDIMANAGLSLARPAWPDIAGIPRALTLAILS
jgi:release factor glutamine methyltransferase